MGRTDECQNAPSAPLERICAPPPWKPLAPCTAATLARSVTLPVAALLALTGARFSKTYQCPYTSLNLASPEPHPRFTLLDALRRHSPFSLAPLALPGKV
jgi:hypothetical protein